MTPSEICKLHGFNLKFLSDNSGVSEQTLINWHKNKPDLFALVVSGTKAKTKSPTVQHAKFTEGKWSLNRDRQYDEGVFTFDIIQNDGTIFEEFTQVFVKSEDDTEPDPEIVANAYLMFASKDLYNALHSSVGYIADNAKREECEIALSKARGVTI